MESYVGTLPAARMSPRLINGALKWYEGDTFKLQVKIELTDENDDVIDITDSHVVDFVFRDEKKRVVWAMRFENIKDNTVALVIDEDVTMNFPKGEYTYDVIYSGTYRKTLVNEAPITVE